MHLRGGDERVKVLLCEARLPTQHERDALGLAERLELCVPHLARRVVARLELIKLEGSSPRPEDRRA